MKAMINKQKYIWWQSSKSKDTPSSWRSCWGRAATVVSTSASGSRPRSGWPSKSSPRRIVPFSLSSRSRRLSQGRTQERDRDPPETAFGKYSYVLRRHGELQKLLHYSVTLRRGPLQRYQKGLPEVREGGCWYAKTDLQRFLGSCQRGYHP